MHIHMHISMHPQPLPQVRVLNTQKNGEPAHTLLCLYALYVPNSVYFSPLRVKNKLHEWTRNVHLFLGLLARLRTVTF
jgi:hypothetical protein